MRLEVFFLCTFIGIESLAANALISLLEKDSTIREVSFSALVSYGMEIVRIYQCKTGEEAILLLSREYQMHMIADYSDFFDVKMEDDGQGIFYLKNGIGTDILRDYFQWTMDAELLNAFMAPEALAKIGV